MSDARVRNAVEARTAADAVDRTIIVTGDEPSRSYWVSALEQGSGSADRRPCTVISERGRKGNFLGALQAYERVLGNEFSRGGPTAFDQLVMLVGSGTRLSPITQSLRNMKAALILPSNDGDRSELTVGEAAIRSSAPWVRVLREGGFSGVVLRWGDEIIIPSSELTSRSDQYAGVDAVRFGYRARPTDLLATQKEWLLCDEEDNVYAELPRQPLDRLLDRVSNFRTAKTLHVNLGSFAASHQLLRALSMEFEDLLDREGKAANWDPYFWIALHSDDRLEWEESCRAGSSEVPRDFANLLTTIPDFWARTQRAKERLSEMTGRPLAVKVLDFGEPYWFDAGNHSSLRSGMGDIFAPSRDGDTIRAFLGLPDGLSAGESFVRGGAIAPGAAVRNSIIIGTEIRNNNSFAERAIVINSRLGLLRADPGSVVIECDSESLTVDGPAGFAFRIDGYAHVGGDEISARVDTARDSMRLSHFDATSIVDDSSFKTRMWANPVSFQEAAELVAQFEPRVLVGRAGGAIGRSSRRV